MQNVQRSEIHSLDMIEIWTLMELRLRSGAPFSFLGTRNPGGPCKFLNLGLAQSFGLVDDRCSLAVFCPVYLDLCALFGLMRGKKQRRWLHPYHAYIPTYIQL